MGGGPAPQPAQAGCVTWGGMPLGTCTLSPLLCVRRSISCRLTLPPLPLSHSPAGIAICALYSSAAALSRIQAEQEEALVCAYASGEQGAGEEGTS